MKNTEQKMVDLMGLIFFLETAKEKLIDKIKKEQEVDSEGVRNILSEIKRDACKIIDAVDVVLN